MSSPAPRPDQHAQLIAHLDVLEDWTTWTRGALQSPSDTAPPRPASTDTAADPLDGADVAASDDLSVAHALLNLASALGGALQTVGAAIDAQAEADRDDRAGLVVSIVGDAILDAADAADDYVVEVATR